MQAAVLLLLCSSLLCYARCADDLCVDRAAVNTAADLLLYFLKHNETDYTKVSDVYETFLRGTVRLVATDGKFGRVHSLERVGDIALDFTDEKSNNPDKPTSRKMYAAVKAGFSQIHVEFGKSLIHVLGCDIAGSISVTVKNNLFEVFTVSSDKQNCFMDIRLIKFHKFGPIDFNIDALDGKLCASLATTAVNLFVKFFRDFTERKIRELLIEIVSKRLPPKHSVLCLSPIFDVQFVDFLS